MASVSLGNLSHTPVITDPETGARTRYRSTNVTQSTTIMHLPAESLYDRMHDVVNLWGHSSDQPPAWVESDDEPLATALRQHFGCGPRPEDWENVITGPPATEPLVPGGESDR